MANSPFDRTIINPRERPLSSDINQAQSQLDRSLRDALSYIYSTRVSQTNPGQNAVTGFLGNGFRVNGNGTNMSLTLEQGLGFYVDGSTGAVGGVIGLDDFSVYKPLLLNSSPTITVPTAPTAPNSRIDIIEVQFKRTLNNPLTRDILDIGTGTFMSGIVNKTMEFGLDNQITINGAGAINYKTGNVAVSPSVPVTDSGYYKIAEIRVSSGVTAIFNSDIVDSRPLIWPASGTTISGTISVHEAANNIVVDSHFYTAPPGVTPIASTAGVVDSEGFYMGIYVLAGQSSTLGHLTATCSGSSLGTMQHVPALNTVPSIITANVGIQTDLFANGFPSTRVAEGQTLQFFQLQALKLSAPNVVAKAGAHGSGDAMQYHYIIHLPT